MGRFYLTTPKALDEIREKFTLSVDNITSYQLGKAQLGKLPDQVVISIGGDEDSTEADAGTADAAGHRKRDNPSTLPSVEIERVNHEIIKVPYLL